jgi:hypothetical protein
LILPNALLEVGYPDIWQLGTDSDFPGMYGPACDCKGKAWDRPVLTHTYFI